MKKIALTALVLAFGCATAQQTTKPTTLHTSWKEITPYMEDYLHIQDITNGRVNMITICEKNTETANMTQREKALDQTAYALLMRDTQTFIPLLRAYAQSTPQHTTKQQAQEHILTILQDPIFRDYICASQDIINNTIRTLEKDNLIAFNTEYNTNALRHTRMILLQKENKSYERIKQELKNYPVPDGAFYIKLCK